MKTVDLFTVLVVLLGTAESRPITKRRYLEDFADLVQPGPTLEFSYNALAPASVCGHNLLIDCQNYDQGIPCEIHNVKSNRICGCFNEGSVVGVPLKSAMARTESEAKEARVSKKYYDISHYPAKKSSLSGKDHQEGLPLNRF